MLVDFQPKTMPGAVKESDTPASAHFSWKTALGEKFLNRLVNRHPIDSRLDSLQSKRLTGLHCIPKLSLSFARASAQNRARHVAKISRLRVARRPEKPVSRANTDLVRSEFLSVSESKICGDNY